MDYVKPNSPHIADPPGYPYLAAGVIDRVMLNGCVRKVEVSGINSIEAGTVTIEYGGSTYENVPVVMHTDYGCRRKEIKAVEEEVDQVEGYFERAALQFIIGEGDQYKKWAGTAWETNYQTLSENPEALALFYIQPGWTTYTPLCVFSIVQNLPAAAYGSPAPLLGGWPSYRPYFSISSAIREGGVNRSEAILFDPWTGGIAQIPNADFSAIVSADFGATIADYGYFLAGAIKPKGEALTMSVGAFSGAGSCAGPFPPVYEGDPQWVLLEGSTYWVPAYPANRCVYSGGGVTDQSFSQHITKYSPSLFLPTGSFEDEGVGYIEKPHASVGYWDSGVLNLSSGGQVLINIASDSTASRSRPGAGSVWDLISVSTTFSVQINGGDEQDFSFTYSYNPATGSTITSWPFLDIGIPVIADIHDNLWFDGIVSFFHSRSYQKTSNNGVLSYSNMVANSSGNYNVTSDKLGLNLSSLISHMQTVYNNIVDGSPYSAPNTVTFTLEFFFVPYNVREAALEV